MVRERRFGPVSARLFVFGAPVILVLLFFLDDADKNTTIFGVLLYPAPDADSRGKLGVLFR